MSDDRDLAPDDDLRAAEPPDAATQAQIAATAPDASAWVAANAGSGKTSVLTRRVARLLLGRCPPQRILCLTYTRAAAAEMQARLNRMLGEWAMMEDAALALALADLCEPGRPDAARLAEARRLFAAALETPGGLKIQTIHAFCASLLRRFPLEAGAPPGFAELDEAGAARLLEDLREQAALAAEAGADPAFDGVAARAADLTVAKLLAALPGLRDGVPDAAEAAEAALRRVFQMSPGADPSPTYALIWENIEPSDMRGLAAALAASGGADGKQAPALLAAAEARDAGDMVAAGLSLERFGLTAAGTPRSTRSFPTKATRAARPSAFDETLTLIDMAESLRKLRLDHAAVEASAALHALARRVLAGYAREKAARGALDFEDLIRRTLALVSTASAAAWALRRLDGGLDHVLVDEAQDTSPAQWKIIEALTQEFFAGAGARLLPRTVFAVGDEKQSIYSFQGAAPREFGAMREHFAQLAAAASGAASGQASGEAPGAAAPFARRSLDWSFRSAPAILRAVDAALASEGKALASDGAAPSHRAFLAKAPGLVELWPPFEPAPTAEAEDPLGPVDAARPASPKMRLAEAVAAHVDDLLREGAPIWDGKAAGWRPMRPGDVMILLRARGRLAPALIAGLKGRGVPVAGADRLHMLGSLAVLDCLSLLRATLDRRDDLSAAEALRSPFCGMSEGAFEDLATTRAGAPLLAALADRATEFPHAAAVFAALAGAADFDRPYDLLQTVLIRHGGRARLRARAGMGPEQEEAVDALLAQALAYESVEAPTLPGFLDWLQAGGDAPLKRDMDDAGDAVRVMTVHGAKGLEAGMVILPDCGPSAGRHEDLLTDPEEKVALWAAPGTGGAPGLETAKTHAAEREAEESRRLLYVAMTRARSRLLVAGALARAAKPGERPKGWEDSWHGLVEAGLREEGAEWVDPPPALDGEAAIDVVLQLADGWSPNATLTLSPQQPEEAGDASADAGAGWPAPVPPDPAAGSQAAPEASEKRDSASALGGEATVRAEPAAPAGPPQDRDLARRYGDAVHLLLELLPPLPQGARRARGETILAAQRPALPPDRFEAALEEALAALADPAAADLLDPDALAEAPVTARLAPDRRVTGRIDRLLIRPDGVRLLDWKTGPAPATPRDAPEPYLRQMAAYRAALQVLHPGLPVEAALYWTSARRLDPLDPAALDAALERWRAEAAGARAPAEAPSPPPRG